MENEKSKILVRDILSQQTLFACEIAESEKAYQYAAQMEELGIEVEVISPTLAETLTASLGLSAEAREQYQKSLEEEMDSHEGSCCFEESSTSDKVH